MHRAWPGGALAEERVIGLKEGNKEGNGFLSRLGENGSATTIGCVSALEVVAVPPAPTLGLVPFVLGVTGHRVLPSNDLATIEHVVRERFAWLRWNMPHTPIVVVSAQAEGADRLVAKMAMKEGFEVWTVLPTQAEEYEKDFVTDGSRNEFRQILEGSARVLNASALAGQSPGSTERPQIYVDAGNEICRLSHALLAIWDGQDSDRPGGTALVITTFRTGRFDNAARTGLSFPDCGMVFHVPVGTESTESALEDQHNRTLVPHLGEAGKPFLPQGEHELRRRFTGGMHGLDSFNRRAKERLPKPDNKADELLPRAFAWRDDAVLTNWLSLYSVADSDSYAAMSRRHRALKAVVILFALSMMMTLLYGGLITGSSWPLLLGLALLGVSYLVYRSHRNSEDDNVWIGCRALSEFLRVAISWRACGIHEPFHHGIADEQILPMDWLGMASRWIDNEARITKPPEHSTETAKTVAAHWINGQVDYVSGSKNRIDHHGKKARKFGMTSATLIGLALVVNLLTIVLDYVLSTQSRDLALEATAWTMYGYWALLSLAAVVAAYSGIMAHAEHESEYSHALIKFRIARAGLAETSSSEIQRDLLIKLGKSAVRETAGWVRLHMGRPLRLPF